ncbi:hypothetical protein ACFPK9_14820 [Rubritalea spongiae]|uniref:DUF2127 domain-containing protein n=1 Tax=Rubritalea spongiae TaxID=430797 RepID=A0ABW5DZ50_9BACT
MHSDAPKPNGTVVVPATLCALTGSVLAVGMELMGFFRPIETLLHKIWLGEPFLISEPVVVMNYVNWGIAFVVSWLVALVVLDSANLWRRLLIGAISLVLLIGAVPCLVLWDVEWMAMVPLLALMWTWCCALVYASQHRMPCDKLAEVRTKSVELKVETIPFPAKERVN